jgi:hypothetical protein
MQRHADTTGTPDGPLGNDELDARRQQQRDARPGQICAITQQIGRCGFRSLQQLLVRQIDGGIDERHGCAVPASTGDQCGFNHPATSSLTRR